MTERERPPNIRGTTPDAARERLRQAFIDDAIQQAETQDHERRQERQNETHHKR